MEKTEWKRYVKGAVIALNCLAIFFMVYAITASAGYTVLLGDDFTHGVRVGIYHAPFFQYFAASLQYMKEIYLDWQGTYFAMFIQAFLSPINNFGLPQLKVVMVGNALFFFATLFGVIWTALGFLLKEKKMPYIRLSIFSVILFSILDADVFMEIFFWYSGAAAYSVPFSFLLLGILFFLLLNNSNYSIKKKNIFCVCAAVFLFCASGGSLTVTGTGCYVIILLCLGFYLTSGRISMRNIAVIAAGIIGALINVVAPGNFSRHANGNEGGTFMLGSAVKWSIKNVWSEIERLTKETMFGVMLLAMVLLGIYLAKRIESVIKAYGIVSILALLAGYVTAFPVALGYSGSYFPNRCCFILDVVLVLSLLNFTFFCGCCLEKWGHVYENKSACAVLLVVFFTAFLFSPEAISDSSLITVAESLHNGTYRNYYEECTTLYDYLENCEEDNVVVEVPDYIDNFECFYLDEDETGWVNVGMAKYYGKESIRRKAQ